MSSFSPQARQPSLIASSKFLSATLTMPATAPSPPVLHSFPTSHELCDALAHFIIKAQKEAVEKKGRFTVAISGGSLPTQLNALIGKPGVKWDKWCASSVPGLEYGSAHARCHLT